MPLGRAGQKNLISSNQTTDNRSGGVCVARFVESGSSIMGALSRLRRGVGSDRWFFVTCRMLPREGF